MRLELFDKQNELARAALSGDYRYLVYGGAIRGGKTVVLLALFFTLARIFPGSRWCLVRSDLPKIKRNLLPAFEKFKPPFFGPVNRSDWTCRAENGSELLFMPESFRDDPAGDRFRGMEVNGFGMEECNELQEATFTRMMERVGTWHAPGLDTLGLPQPPRLILGTCNPALGWVKDRFHDPHKLGALRPPYFYLPARADDNPHVSAEQKAAWKDLPEPAYRRFVLGDWDVADEPDQLIKFEWVHAARDAEHEPGEMSLGVDVARFGNDATVLAFLRGNTLTEIKEYQSLSIDRTAAIVGNFIGERGIPAGRVAVDTVGLGAGVADILRRDGHAVRDVVSGAKALGKRVGPKIERGAYGATHSSSFTFRNLRSQMWWHAREMLRGGAVRLAANHQKLADDLLAPRYSVAGDRMIEVESKDSIKKRLGRSTDYGDAFVYGLFAEHLHTGIDWNTATVF